MSDILRVFSKFQIGQSDLSVSLVEVSPYLSQVQEKRLCMTNNSDSKEGKSTKDANHYKQSTSLYGSPVRWYNHLSDVPRTFTLYLAHEFFDALPVHKLVKSNQGWREVLIDINREDSTLRYVLSRDRTPASLYCLVTMVLYIIISRIITILKIQQENETRKELEVSPQSLVTIQLMATRIHQDGGFICNQQSNLRSLKRYFLFNRYWTSDGLWT